MAGDNRKKSAYAQKQGRSRKYSGDDHDGPRSRVAPTSPFSDLYVSNPHHRLAEYAARGDALQREAERSSREFDGAPYGRHRGRLL